MKQLTAHLDRASRRRWKPRVYATIKVPCSEERESFASVRHLFRVADGPALLSLIEKQTTRLQEKSCLAGYPLLFRPFITRRG